MQTRILVLAATVCLFGVATYLGAQPGVKKPGGPGDPRPKTKSAPTITVQWEYRVLGSREVLKLGNVGNPDLEAGLNKLGADGWELVAIEPEGGPRTSIFYFRRPKLAKAKRGGPDPAPQPAPKEKANATFELRLYTLKHASAAELARILEKVLRSGNDDMRIAAEPRTNQLIVNASGEVQHEIGALVQRLDVPGEQGVAPPGVGAGPGGKK